MSDNNDLEDLLGEFQQAASEKPRLENTLQKMDNDHFMKVAQAVNDEYIKRQDPMANVSSMTDAEFAALRRHYGV